VDTLARLIVLLALAWCFPAWSLVTYQGSTAFVAPAPLHGIPDAGAEIQRILEGSKWPVIVQDKEFIKIGNTKIPIQVSRKIPLSGAVRAAITKCGARCIVTAAAAAAAWCKYETGSFLCDPRQPKERQEATCLRGAQAGFPSYNGCYKSPAEVAAADGPQFVQRLNDLPGNTHLRHSFVGVTSCSGSGPWTCYFTYQTLTRQWDNTWGGAQISTQQWPVTAETKVQELCPPVVNFADPAYSVPGGPPDADGKCPTGRYEPLPEAEAETRLAPQLQKVADPAKVVRELLEDGPELTPYADVNPKTVSGPATASEPATTTTHTSPTGQPQTTTTQTTYNIRYGDNYTTNWTVTTITNNPDGSTETKDETPKDEKSECEKNPDVIGCQKTDTPPGQDLEKRDIEVRYAPQAGWGADNAACPAPPNISVLGNSLQLDLSLFCTFFQSIRFALIGMAAMVGALIFIGGLKN
jgi:hypothetical protein